MENQMFCFQCQETARGTGCTVIGVCGKQAVTARALDLLLFVTRGVAVVSTALRELNIPIGAAVNRFVTDALFTSITNTNFDEEVIYDKIHQGSSLRKYLLLEALEHQVVLPEIDEVLWNGARSEYDRKARTVGVQRQEDEDIRSLTELITYGLKGIAAYQEHARNLGFESEALDAFVQRMLAELCTQEFSKEELLARVVTTGENGVVAMALLDRANTTTYDHPVVTKVRQDVGNRPGILVSGHDLHDLEMLLDQSKNRQIDIYTHGEMLPANAYPAFRKYDHLHGNYGRSWWYQREEFSQFNGPILLTSNCLVPILPAASYQNRLFTTNAVHFPGCKHVEADNHGRKDFSEMIEMAQQCEPPSPQERSNLLIGFAHHQVEELLDRVVEAVRKGSIRKFVVMAGCDGRHTARSYYTDFAQQLPADCVILTAGCAKYRYNMLDLGKIDGIPRLLDAGQCNDSFSLVMVAFQLRDKLGLKDVNDLPLVYNIAWYEQKAVIVLLSLLSLGVRNIVIGPTLPGFLSPNVLQILTERFGLSGNRPEASSM